jgi:transcriptional regulator with XRE-family HTH domain
MGRADEPQPALGKAIRRLREKRGVTQEALAHEAGITTGTLSLIERGQSNPAWGTVSRIAAALDSSIGEIGKVADGNQTG